MNDNTEIRYFLGRLNIIANFQNKQEFLLSGLNTSKYLNIRDFYWGFFDIGHQETEIGTIINGYFAKYLPLSEELVAETNTHKLKDEEARNRVIARSRFFLHVKTGIIAYHPVSGKISSFQFCKHFSKLFEEAFDNFFIDVEIQAIEEQYKLLEYIRKFDFISKVSVYLHPSNPSNRDVWQKVDDKFKKLGASTYCEQISASSESTGLHNLEEDEDLVSKIYMSEDGYGEAKVKGLVKGESKTVSTKDNPVSTLAPGDNVSSELVFKSLISIFTKIIERMKS